MGRIFFGLITAAAGFLGGLFFAPEKGEETRKKAQNLIEKSKSILKELKEELSKKEKDKS